MSQSPDHALIIHVWHLDTLDEISRHVSHFTPDADRFVTYAESFSPEVRRKIAEKLPGAVYVPVENKGQDVGALFQLMEQVDFGRYEFVCKIHTKKGTSLPQLWRQALLNGVLASPEQVEYIVKAFREDKDLQLAGARQLFISGSKNLGPIAQEIEQSFSALIEDFDIYENDWGFIGGTCFWMRTAGLLRIHDSKIAFQKADGYVADGTPAHAVERIFGMYAALSGGKTLLQDLRFPDRMPDICPSYPCILPDAYSGNIFRSLTSLVGGTCANSGGPYAHRSTPSAAPLSDRKRVAVFASYSSDGFLPPQVLPYLAGLKSVTKSIIVVFDNDLAPGEQEKLAPFADHVIVGRHGEYDFGSYKRGFLHARKTGLLDDADDLILCNDSCFGPVNSFAPMFAEMEARGLDFWGATDSHEYSYHLQSYWVVLSRAVFSSVTFNRFINNVKKKANVQQVILDYELGLTKCLIEANFKTGAMVENKLRGLHAKDPAYNNITVFPLYSLEHGLPLVKVKALRMAHVNADGVNRVLTWLRQNTPDLYEAATTDIMIKRFASADTEAFSVIMPTYNRAKCIADAIKNVLAQSHCNFELIIVDDGSTDGTEDIVASSFAKDLAEGRIRYIRLNENTGVSNARNIGINFARYPWIAYADSDNTVRPYYLTMVANAIVENRDRDAFYGRLIMINEVRIVGGEFDRNRFLNQNFIDLGVFVHHKSLVTRFGGFDPDLKCLVDWDLIIRFTAHKPPKYIPRIFLNYSDADDPDRITKKESLSGAFTAVHAKHSVRPTVSTAIVTYNHQDFLVEAIESALSQRGNFTHDIMIADDGSTDGTRRIIEHYVRKYPKLIRNISRGGNFGISENYRHSFRQAAGEFVAILEGDDYWTDDEKILRQAEFLTTQTEAAMVFSRIELANMATGRFQLSKIQNELGAMLTGADIAKSENLNPIMNFSCTMFRAHIMRHLPADVYRPRFSEIPLSFYLDRIGKIGFLDKVMGTYRQHPSGVWSGASQASRLQQAIAVRQSALRVANRAYHADIRRHIDEKQDELAALEAMLGAEDMV